MFKRNQKKPSHKKRNAAALGIVVLSALAYGAARAFEHEHKA